MISGSRGTWQHIKETEELHRRAGSCYKHSITAVNSATRDSSYIKEGFRLRLSFVETWIKGGEWGGVGGHCSKNCKRM